MDSSSSPTATASSADAAATALFEQLFASVQHANHDLLNAAIAARMLVFFTFAILVYDHLLTLPREITLVWRAPASLSKFAFLLNRYMVPAGLAVIVVEMSGFVGLSFTDMDCRNIITMAFVVGCLSVAIANAMVLMRVLALWDHQQVIKYVLIGTFVACYGGVFGTLIMTMINVLPGMRWQPVVGMCVNTTTSPYLLGVWASEMVFEIVVLTATCWNAIDRPRAAQQPLTHALLRDGILYFASITACRLINLILAATGSPAHAFIALFATWALVTLFVSRMLLRLRALDRAAAAPAARPSLFGRGSGEDARSVARASKRDSGLHTVDPYAGWELDTCGEIEVGKVELVVADR